MMSKLMMSKLRKVQGYMAPWQTAGWPVCGKDLRPKYDLYFYLID